MFRHPLPLWSSHKAFFVERREGRIKDGKVVKVKLLWQLDKIFWHWLAGGLITLITPSAVQSYP